MVGFLDAKAVLGELGWDGHCNRMLGNGDALLLRVSMLGSLYTWGPISRENMGTKPCG